MSCPHACVRKPPWATKAGDRGPFAANMVAHARAHWHKGLKGPLCTHVPMSRGRPHHPPAALRGAPGAGTPHAGAGSRGVLVAPPGVAVSPCPQGATCPLCSATLSLWCCQPVPVVVARCPHTGSTLPQQECHAVPICCQTGPEGEGKWHRDGFRVQARMKWWWQCPTGGSSMGWHRGGTWDQHQG